MSLNKTRAAGVAFGVSAAVTNTYWTEAPETVWLNTTIFSYQTIYVKWMDVKII